MNESFSFLSIPVLIGWLLLPISFFAVAVFSNWTRNPLKLRHCWRISEGLLLATLAITGIVGVLLLLDAWLIDTGLPEQGARLGLYPDALAVWMGVMVAFIGWVILRYARDYLAGDPARETFLPWFLTTLACVLLLVFTDHMLVLAGAWIGVSLALHQLLTLYGDRPEARLAAAQKFIASRLGDVCVITSVLLLWSHYGTFRLPEMIEGGAVVGQSSATLTLASVLLAVAAILKCAQIPFHGWLLRVMEAPTPVSALLHAGVINLGGFLWLRLFPVFEGFTAGHALLLVVGGGTALIAVLTMMTQTSVKHALAWSTISQMGFMLFEIALGAYVLALLHLLAHSLYKAHSFLASGRTVKVSAISFHSGSATGGNIMLAGAGAALATLILWLWPDLVEGKSVLAGLLVLAVTSVIMGIPNGASAKTRALVMTMALMLVPLYGALHAVLGGAFGAHEAMVPPLEASIVAWGILIALALLSALILVASRSRAVRVLQARFSQGLRLEQPFEQITRKLASDALNVPHKTRDHLSGYPATAGERS
ncbi:NADH-quinone oxidoreductase subunit L [Marinobacter pelagius]|uniref:Probable inorganic carbon transporter subunit DabB n=1 Tax=Marinobacter pelagius TaxID=379482 RepID=A0A1I4ZME4_9GAMM|nr:NADH-quinone oxidoreductase subunit L [Marinobacter pelagius]SFN51441.1 NAD(P)H-quinone oxidoreductase subunit 5 [Marinobacter pelagius]